MPIVAVGRNRRLQIVLTKNSGPQFLASTLIPTSQRLMVLTDSGSTYGTFVNGQLIKEPTRLR